MRKVRRDIVETISVILVIFPGDRNAESQDSGLHGKVQAD